MTGQDQNGGGEATSPPKAGDVAAGNAAGNVVATVVALLYILLQLLQKSWISFCFNPILHIRVSLTQRLWFLRAI